MKTETYSAGQKNIISLLDHPLFSTDSYKFSHFYQYDPDIVSIYDYYENRGGKNPAPIFFGLKYYLKRYLTQPLTMDHVHLMERYAKLHGIPFNAEGFRKVVARFGGLLPVKIRAVPEKQKYPTSVPLFTVESTGGPEFVWVAGMLETLLMKVWYPSAVASKASMIKKTLQSFYNVSSENPDIAINYGYHNFGARGSTTEEQALVGGLAHLQVFKGTDNFKSIVAAEVFYNQNPENFVSIPATEHSTTTSMGRENEFRFLYDYVKNSIDLGYKMFAAVADSYDVYRFVDYATNKDSPVRKLLEESGAKLILRPDSGDPVDVLRDISAIMKVNGVLTKNSIGYLTSNNFGVIWGDGVNPDTIEKMAELWLEEGMSMDILAFGSGGDLMQNVNRDTHKTAIKASSVLLKDGTRRDVFKDPITDPGKTSKKGRVTTCKIDGEFVVVDMDSPEYDPSTDIMQTVYHVE
jgi:nicotinamide phosphoribosyltransferase